MRTGTLEGPAASEEASQHPVLFDTLEYRKQNPERELFPKYLKGGQSSILPEGSASGTPGQWMSGRPEQTAPQGEDFSVRFTRGTGWESPREEESQESQGADCAGEIRWRTSQPAGG
jgi:hypothetical protein